MTNVYREKARSGWRLEVWVRGVRRRLWLGNMSKRIAERIRDHVHELKTAVEMAVPADPSALHWSEGVDVRIANKLADWGLIPKRGQTARTMRLSQLCDQHIAKRTDWSESNRVWMNRCRNQLVEILGDVFLDKLSEWHAKEFFREMKAKYSPATAAKQMQRARQLIGEGKGIYFEVNPFSNVKAPSDVNKANQRYIDLSTIDSVLKQLPDLQLRFAVMMARLSGLRIPSELLELKWSDIDWETSRIIVRSPKLIHYPSKYRRTIPILPSIKPTLEQLFECADEGAEYIFTWRRNRNVYQLLTKFLRKAIKQAGLEIWPRLFVNLRASARTDLLRRHPTHVVNDWLGHDGKIGAKHYDRVTSEDFAAATAPTVATTKRKKPTKPQETSDKK